LEKRIGLVAILIENKEKVKILNSILNDYSEMILGRQGLPLREKGIHVISLIIEGSTDDIGALTGKIGKLDGVQVKSVLTKFKELIEGE